MKGKFNQLKNNIREIKF